MAGVFGIERWPVAAVKAYLGHSLAPASGEQLTSALGTWQYGWLPGIATVDAPAEDVARDHLRLSQAHTETDPAHMDMALVKSKGFGGNNATGLVLSPNVARELLAATAGSAAMKRHAKKKETVCAAASAYDSAARAGTAKTIYRYGEGVLTGDDLAVTKDAIEAPGVGGAIPQRWKIRSSGKVRLWGKHFPSRSRSRVRVEAIDHKGNSPEIRSKAVLPLDTIPKTIQSRGRLMNEGTGYARC